MREKESFLPASAVRGFCGHRDGQGTAVLAMRRGRVSWVCSSCSGDSEEVVVQGGFSFHSLAFLWRTIERRGKLFSDMCRAKEQQAAVCACSKGNSCWVGEHSGTGTGFPERVLVLYP